MMSRANLDLVALRYAEGGLRFCPDGIIRNFNKVFRGFPGVSVVKNPPANVRDMGSIPNSGRSHMPWTNYTCVPQLLSLCSRTWELQLLSPHALGSVFHKGEAPVMRSPHMATRELHFACNQRKVHAAVKTQHS